MSVMIGTRPMDISTNPKVDVGNFGNFSQDTGSTGNTIKPGNVGETSPINFGDPLQKTAQTQQPTTEGTEAGGSMKDKILEILMMIIQLIMMLLKGGDQQGGKEGAGGPAPAGGPGGGGAPSGAGGPGGGGAPSGAGGPAGAGGAGGAAGPGNPNAPGKEMGFGPDGKFQIGDKWGGWDGVSDGTKGSSHDTNDRAALVGQLGKMGLDDGAAHRVAQHLHKTAGATGLDAHKGQHSDAEAAGIKAKNHANIKEVFNNIGDRQTTEAEMTQMITDVYAKNGRGA
ncbi:hypothetical protein [Agarilytica rhodophyticola]|uniref:hypothetical protein n=1 Tax=Agarilytica rhodophyticola TaxID=1737490 RepID=UPI00156DD1E5|nr:hypothetical protein [Agarilytica rhodophyticola]